jgi:Zn-dependent protease
VLLQEPQETPYDFRFSIFGFDVRVSPFFFLMPLILFSGLIQFPGVNPGVGALIVEAVVFVSILVHELGHTFAFRFFGIESHIVLYAMGGLAIPGTGRWTGARSNRSLTGGAQIVVSLAGPIAGLLLAGLIVLGVYGMGGRVEWFFDSLFPVLWPDFSGTEYANKPELTLFVIAALFCGVFWNVLNLVPIFPLDGGQVARQLFQLFDPWNGFRNAMYVSIGAAVIMALLGMRTQNTFMAIFFGFMAYQNYQMLMMSGGGGGRPW